MPMLTHKNFAIAGLFIILLAFVCRVDDAFAREISVTWQTKDAQEQARRLQEYMYSVGSMSATETGAYSDGAEHLSNMNGSSSSPSIVPNVSDSPTGSSAGFGVFAPSLGANSSQTRVTGKIALENEAALNNARAENESDSAVSSQGEGGEQNLQNPALLMPQEVLPYSAEEGRKRAFTDALYAEALAMCGPLLREERANLLQRYMPPSALSMVQSYSLVRSTALDPAFPTAGRTDVYDVQINKKVLREALRAMGICPPSTVPVAYKLELSGGSSDDWETLRNLQTLYGLETQNDANMILSLQFLEGQCIGELQENGDLRRFSGENLEMVWRVLWGAYFTAQADTAEKNVRQLFLDVSGWTNLRDVQKFDSKLISWDSALSKADLVFVKQYGSNITARWLLSPRDKVRLEERLVAGFAEMAEKANSAYMSESAVAEQQEENSTLAQQELGTTEAADAALLQELPQLPDLSLDTSENSIEPEQGADATDTADASVAATSEGAAESELALPAVEENGAEPSAETVVDAPKAVRVQWTLREVSEK